MVLTESELIFLTETVRPDLSRIFPPSLLVDRLGNSRVLKNNFELLGAPLGSTDHCASYTRERVEDARQLVEALSFLADPQVGLRLLRWLLQARVHLPSHS